MGFYFIFFRATEGMVQNSEKLYMYSDISLIVFSIFILSDAFA